MQNRIIELFLFYPLFLFSLSFHEAAHALVAHKLGDSTAKFLGRVSLSPLPHIDPIGTVFLPILGILTGAPVIGWGKPVPVNPYNLRGEMRKSNMWVAACGPISNIILALVFAGITHILFGAVAAMSPDSLLPGSFRGTTFAVVFRISETGVMLNLVLAFFNLIPLPPLDGGAVLRGILPASSLEWFDQISRYGFIILLVLFATGMLRYILIPAIVLANMLLPM